jgi:hypothetical protein
MPQRDTSWKFEKIAMGLQLSWPDRPRHNFFFLDLHQNEDADSPRIADRILGQNET